jgi:uncharacterized membrane protein
MWPWTSSRRRLLHRLDIPRIEEALRAAERRTSGEIRVSVAPFFWGSVRRAAETAFVRLGMTETRQRNGVLFFVVPARRRFVVLGDEGIHARVGPDFWESVAARVAEAFHAGDFTGGLVRGITAVGEQLSAHFPYQPGEDINELPDTVDMGPRPPER